jgi:hypothetical protein
MRIVAVASSAAAARLLLAETGDANVVVTMLAHGVGTVVTMNVTDFARFERYVSLVEL